MGEDLKQSNENLHRNKHENELHHILHIRRRPVRLGHRERRDGTRWHKMALEIGRVRTSPAQRIMIMWIFGLTQLSGSSWVLLNKEMKEKQI